MRILWLSHLVPYPPTGLGVLQRSHNLLNELVRVGDVFLFAFVQRDVVRELLGDVDVGIEEARTHLSISCRDVRFVLIPSELRTFGQAKLAFRSLLRADPYTIDWLRSQNARAILGEWNERLTSPIVRFDTLSRAPYKQLFPARITTVEHHNVESQMM